MQNRQETLPTNDSSEPINNAHNNTNLPSLNTIPPTSLIDSVNISDNIEPVLHDILRNPINFYFFYFFNCAKS